MPPLGAHMSTAGGLEKAIYKGKKTGCEVIQLFTRENTRWKVKRLSCQEIEAFLRAAQETGVKAVASHDSYLINLASPRTEIREKSFRALADELERTRLLKIPYLVMHPGSHLGDGERRGIERVAQALEALYNQTKAFTVTILLETTAGQGTQLGYRLEQLAEIMELCKLEENLGLCIDTCHMFAAGYEFGTAEKYDELIKAINSIIGLEKLRLVHVNDSKRGLGSRVDRHEAIGRGRIGLKPFGFFLNDPRFKGIPFILETPKGIDENGMDMDLVNLATLRKLERQRSQIPPHEI